MRRLGLAAYSAHPQSNELRHNRLFQHSLSKLSARMLLPTWRPGAKTDSCRAVGSRQGIK